VTSEEYDSLKTLTSDFKDFTAASSAQLETLRILAGLSRTQLQIRAHADAARYARCVREGMPHSAGARQRIVEVLRESVFKGLGPDEILAEQRHTTGRRIRLIKRFGSFDEDIVKWF